MRIERQINNMVYGVVAAIMFNILPSCSQNAGINKEISEIIAKDSLLIIQPGAHSTREYFPELTGKKVAVVANHTSLIGQVLLVDSMISAGIHVVKIFCPEHGYKGNAGAGEIVGNHREEKNNIEIVSLYGKDYKPKKTDMEGVDIVVFDLQDVGVRFYTYISTLHYVMESCAENHVPLLVLDRPNPNGYYVDGPVLDLKYRSFVGMHQIPVVHGLTIAELATMINGEGWLKDSIKCDLQYVLCSNYTHDSLYQLTVSPSPNLQTMQAVYLYPSVGLFEGTLASVGRGTDFPFLVFGFPMFPDTSFSFTPRVIEQVSPNPKYKGKKCYGRDFRDTDTDNLIKKKQIQIEWIISAYQDYHKDDFFIPFINNLAGNKIFAQQIKEGKNAEPIRKSWEAGISEYMRLRKRYLLYEDFK
ncbi:MAG: DUF1343 domain-containing protein [Bacteroidales bacterium]|nr:DUF1343 domain-containing protein [Bacteroidales bacterium]